MNSKANDQIIIYSNHMQHPTITYWGSKIECLNNGRINIYPDHTTHWNYSIDDFPINDKTIKLIDIFVSCGNGNAKSKSNSLHDFIILLKSVLNE